MALGRKLARLRRLLLGAVDVLKGDNQDQLQVMTESRVLRQSWKRYSATFIAVPGERQKTERSAREFFRDLEIVSQEINLRFYLALPNILVGLGVLGTFAGLAVGVDNFDTQSVEGVRSSISVLLAGMSTAFYTSIAGMVCSIAFNFYEKAQLKSITRLTDRFTARLDERFLMTRKDRDRIENQMAERQIKMQAAVLAQVLTNLFAVDYPDGTTMAPAYVLRDLKLEAEEQTRVLKRFVANITDSMGISKENSTDGLSRRIGQSIGAEIRDVFAGGEIQNSLVMFSAVMREMQERSKLLNKDQAYNQEEIQRIVLSIKDMMRSGNELSRNLNEASERMNELLQHLSVNGKT